MKSHDIKKPLVDPIEIERHEKPNIIMEFITCVLLMVVLSALFVSISLI